MMASRFIVALLCVSITACFTRTVSIRSIHKATKLHVIENIDSCTSIEISNALIDNIFATGVAGSKSAVLQVISLMWLRTALNYQYKYGTSTVESIKSLYNDGGIGRLYQGLPFALLQSPLSRFGDTASNQLALSIVSMSTLSIPPFITTLLGSVTAGAFRILLLPIDTIKTSLQVYGNDGIDIVKARIKNDGIGALFSGAVAASAATVVGHYPWFLVYNSLSASLPTPDDVYALSHNMKSIDHDLYYYMITYLGTLDTRLLVLFRSAFIGLCASSSSDICSNSLRIIKTTRQTDVVTVSYMESVRSIVDKDGVKGLLTRGLQTRYVDIL